MKTIELKTSHIEQLIVHLGNELGGTLQSNDKEYTLKMDNEMVDGEITGMSINKNISFIQYDVIFKQDTLLVRNTPVTNPIYFLYCAGGQVSHSFGLYGKQRALNQFQTGIFASEPSKSSCLFFRKDQPVQLSNIIVNTHSSKAENEAVNLLQQQLLQTFIPKGDSEIFAYIGSYNLKIAEKIKHLESIKQHGIVRRLLIKGIAHTMLALEIEQHNRDMNNAENNYGSLTRSEMDTIHQLSVFIQNYPEVNYSLAYLSKKGGMSPAKLQEGFKLLHNRTVSDYIRNVRVETAENLIKTTDLNISEIVYTVGLTSRSYFSKIFKEKYNCSPKYYQDRQNQVAATA
ncbi:Transcriptional regulator, AraC family [Croceitalea dokdonensis DOKDO 023]|uniref:Transcriptional regulator, AraC family n=1 Tax=Croceitalea dokdonensis DOKDO 023 TaxID=1300341 RepID=A0A0P7AFL8_9FLAO|nr:helix-turn-helix transcriptional regulator [Croceitalea dokdonensis]KPM32105.1 Transcriptional regulator, AraC family [Croceitalea dokdonensis DOKDO 023]